jgi:MSHA biogenesis protein MshG
MYTLLKSGVPIMNAVKHLADNARSQRLAQVLTSVAEDLGAGRSLGLAMQQHPTVFSPLLVGMVRVGENTGHLNEVFLHLTGYLELEDSTIKRAKSAIRYPTFVIAAIVVGIIIINIFVIPVFAKVYTRAHISLPKITIFLIKISAFFVTYWLMILIFVIFSFIGIRYYLNTPNGRFAWDKFQLQLPIVGVLLKRIILLRFAQTFAIVANSGIPIVEGLTLVAQSINNAYARQEIMAMQDAIQHGNSIIQAARVCKLFTPIELQMLGVAEETGELGAMLHEIAFYYQREVDYDLKRLTDLIEPVLLIAISIMVLLMALAVYLPIWNMVKLAHQ